MNKQCKISCAFLLALALAFTLFPATSVFAGSAPVAFTSAPTNIGAAAIPEKKFEDDQLLVTFAADASLDKQINKLSAKLDVDADTAVEVIKEGDNGSSTALFTLNDDTSLTEAMALAGKDGEVLAAQPNYVYTLLDTAAPFSINDPYGQSANPSAEINQWYLYKPDIYNAWQQLGAATSVRVAVIDSGLRMTHNDLKDSIDTVNAWDAVKKTALKTDISGHGTHVAGIIGAKANNRMGIAGVAYNNAQILPVNVFEVSKEKPDSPVAHSSTIISALDYLIKLKLPDLRVVNMSLGMYGYSDELLELKINEATDAGILVIAAAGNAQTSEVCYPSDYTQTLSVTATDGNDKAASFTDHNKNKDLAAPGVGLLSTWGSADNAFAYSSGTSMASPVVAGVAALLFAQDPNLTVAQVKELLFASAKDLGTAGKDDYFGYGRVDADAALGMLHSNKVGKVVFKDTVKQLAIGKTFNPGVSFLPKNATNKALKWASSNTKIAKVDASGKVTGLKKGKATITATSLEGGKVAICQVSVGTPVKSVKIKVKSKSKRSVQLKAVISPTNADVKSVTWKTSNKKIATINSKGKITAKKAGKVTITVTTKDGKKTAKATLTVRR